MIGWVDPAPEDLECIGNNASAALVDHFIEAAGLYTSLPTLRLIDGSITPSDHSPFWNEGYPAFLGIEDYYPGYPYYHTIQDTVDKVNQAFFTQVTQGAVAAAAELAVPLGIRVQGHSIDDAAGDSDATLDPGETANLVLQVRNSLTAATGPVTLTLACTAGGAYVTLLDASSALASIPGSSTVTTAADPFTIQIAPGTPEFTTLSFLVTVSASEPHSDYTFDEVVTACVRDDAIYELDDGRQSGLDDRGPVGLGPADRRRRRIRQPRPDLGLHRRQRLRLQPGRRLRQQHGETALTTPAFDCSARDRESTLRSGAGWASSSRPTTTPTSRSRANGASWTTIWQNPPRLDGQRLGADGVRHLRHRRRPGHRATSAG